MLNRKLFRANKVGIVLEHSSMIKEILYIKHFSICPLNACIPLALITALFCLKPSRFPCIALATLQKQYMVSEYSYC